MKESYREGVANHPGPEPCECSRKTAPEALDRGICRLGIELRNQRFREPTASGCKEGNNASHASASAARPCGVEDPKHAEKLHAREPGDPVAARGQLAGRGEKAMSHESLMYGSGESSDRIVPTRSANKGRGLSAEPVEGRRSAKETPRHGPMLDTVPENTGALKCRGSTCSLNGLGVSVSEVGTVCVRSASTGLCGGQRVTAVPTATPTIHGWCLACQKVCGIGRCRLPTGSFADFGLPVQTLH